ncbi:MAG: hypothetical protein H7222_05225 [Methylotenera sp.]|nr:hypothetical protein [Oligoflexia bacterium]
MLKRLKSSPLALLLCTGLMAGLSSCSTPSGTRDPASGAAPSNPFRDDRAQCTDFSEAVSPDQNKVIGDVMAEHAHRLNHVLWHATRNSWTSLTPAEKRSIETLSPAWGKNAPICPLPSPSISAAGNSTSGEEFLLMHHHMVDALRVALTGSHLSCIAGWRELPSPRDSLWPVPKGQAGDSSKTSDTALMMDAWMKKLAAPEFLKGKSLSFVGTVIEFSLHNQMHMRWAAIPRAHDDFSPLDSPQSGLLDTSPYDDRKFQWLGNPYSAHVNPVFWKLHGWVDSVIPKWLAANGYSSVSAQCQGDPKCYQWRSSWVGASMHGDAAGIPGHGNHDGHGSPRSLPSVSKAVERTVGKISRSAGFQNRKFDQFHQRASRGFPTPGRAPGRDQTYDDPVVFVNTFGPCSN